MLLEKTLLQFRTKNLTIQRGFQRLFLKIFYGRELKCIVLFYCGGSQIGCGQKKEKHLRKPEVGHFRAQGVPLKRKLREFPVTEDALLPVGTTINVRHFVPGQYVDVTGITRGKGFQVSNFSWDSINFLLLLLVSDYFSFLLKRTPCFWYKIWNI